MTISMSDGSAVSTSPQPSHSPESWHLKPKVILSVTELEALNERSNFKGWLQLTRHLFILVASGTLWGMGWGHGFLAVPALVVYGFSLASMFAVLHECVHRTAFANQHLSDRVAWFAGLLSFYNSTFYRRYHKWHHRYTQIPGKDPELEDLPPSNWLNYLWQLSGFPWWIGKIASHFRIALGQFAGCAYISESARGEVIRSTRWQLLIYGLAIALSLGVGHPWFITYWLFPLAVGQPILRFILFAEHTGCAKTEDPLINTRTTLTIWPIRILMWNMPFHAEHHLYPSIPFHALPKAHQQIGSHLTHVAPGYGSVNRQMTTQFSHE